MKIRSLAVDGFRGLSDQHLSFVDERTNRGAAIVAVTGRGACGKTSLLEAIVAAKETIGPYGALPAPSELIRYDADMAKVTVEWELHNVECERFAIHGARQTSEAIFGDAPSRPADPEPGFAALLAQYDADEAMSKVEYFHAERGMSVGSALDLSKSAGDTLDRVARLAPDNRKYTGLVRFIVEAGLGLDIDAAGNPKPAGRIKHVFDTLCGSKRLGGLYRVNGQVLPGFFDADEKVPYGITQLSSSELDLLLFATTFVRSGLVQNRIGSLVLIDSPEKHVGEQDAGALVSALSALGPENQIIVATRAASVVSAAQQVIRL